MLPLSQWPTTFYQNLVTAEVCYLIVSDFYTPIAIIFVGFQPGNVFVIFSTNSLQLGYRGEENSVVTQGIIDTITKDASPCESVTARQV